MGSDERRRLVEKACPLFAPLLRALGVPQVHAVDTLFVTGVVVALMIFVIMPQYTRWIRRWLFG